MTVEDWNNPSLIDAWLSMSENNGDIYRQFLVNPIIYGLLSSRAWETSASPLQNAFMRWMSSFGKNPKLDPDSGQWYGEWQRQTAGRLSILDLGCGDAYRGRWLSRPNITYVGVDASEGLLRRASEGNAFRCIHADLDVERPLTNVWTDRPPDWVFGITILDHLQAPERLLAHLV